MSEEGKKVVGPNWVAKDDFRLVLDVEEPGNPRLILNLPAGSGFLEITETNPPYLITVSRADNPITAKGVLAHAQDQLLLMEHKFNKAAALSLGVAEAAGKDLKKKLTEGVH